ncbi:DUF4365 domain-containing protein [Pseudoalteromonas ruthenica]|uniref:DUF4365 domain-containing protein n=1 Tax=Pseudoalteromonas ruthenica TaxID=151081 RepID=UPI00110B6606|nr:DUF4365 domain-containing protein [Pseudoalteromonas ruthenica]TMO46442.1 hypothetical protein CWC24_10090 [Pseudoalteromonas ruthenica]TMO50387.1 hypothetical protein CWC23_11695 [Pseudoalteromonas ruthenica]
MSNTATQIRGTAGTAVAHSKELLSLAYIEALASATGVNFNEPKIDNDGIDITLRGKGYSGLYSEPKIEAQLKCTSKKGTIDHNTQELIFQLDAKNYNYLVGPSPIPLILVVHHAPANPSDWLDESNDYLSLKYASYWYSLYGEAKIDTGSKVIRIPLTQRLDSTSLIDMMKMASEGKEILNRTKK